MMEAVDAIACACASSEMAESCALRVFAANYLSCAYDGDSRMLAVVAESGVVRIGIFDASYSFSATAATPRSSANVLALAWAPRVVGKFLAVLYSTQLTIYAHDGQACCSFEFESGMACTHLQWTNSALGTLVLWGSSRVAYLRFNKRQQSLTVENAQIYPPPKPHHSAARISAASPTLSGKVLYIVNDHELHAMHVQDARPSRLQVHISRLLIDPDADVSLPAAAENKRQPGELHKIKALICDGESICFGTAEAGMQLPMSTSITVGQQHANNLRSREIRPLLETLQVAERALEPELGNQSVMESLFNISGDNSPRQPNSAHSQSSGESHAARPRLFMFSWQLDSQLEGGASAMSSDYRPLQLVQSLELPVELAVPDVLAFHRPDDQTIGHLAVGSNGGDVVAYYTVEYAAKIQVTLRHVYRLPNKHRCKGLAFEPESGALMVLSGLRNSASAFVSISATAEFATTMLVIQPEVSAPHATPGIADAQLQNESKKRVEKEAKQESSAMEGGQASLIGQLVTLLQHTNERIVQMESTISKRLDTLELAVHRHTGLLEQLSRELHDKNECK